VFPVTKREIGVYSSQSMIAQLFSEVVKTEGLVVFKMGLLSCFNSYTIWAKQLTSLFAFNQILICMCCLRLIKY